MDFYAISPTFTIEEKKKFRTWWGTFFSFLAICSIMYFVALKTFFYFNNKGTNLVKKSMIHDPNEEISLHVLEFKEMNASIELEFYIDPSIPQSAKEWNTDIEKARIENLIKYLNFTIENHTFDIKNNKKYVNKTKIYPQIFFEGNNIPRAKIDSSLLKVRGDPGMRLIEEEEELVSGDPHS